MELDSLRKVAMDTLGGSLNSRSLKSMANDHAQSVDHPAMDYEEHERTYKLFLRLLKFTAIGVICILILLAFIAG
jgi:Bacterial aa3 type cytochrome c oxidase subunit IV